MYQAWFHSTNNEAATALKYYRSNSTVQFIDHLLSEFNGRFSDKNEFGINLFKTKWLESRQPTPEKMPKEPAAEG